MLDLENLEIIGQGATTKIYRRAKTAIKIYENAKSDEAKNEAKKQTFAYNARLPVPAVQGVRRIDENTVALDMDYIDGQTLMRVGMNKNETKTAIHTLVDLQCMVHKVQANGLPKQSERLSNRIKKSMYLDESQKSGILGQLEHLNSNSENLCHGDFHPLNILFDGNKHWIIDWVDATAGSPLADACRTYVLLREHLKELAEIYLHTFCKETNVDQGDVLAWLPIIAAARLSENVPENTMVFDIGMYQEM